MKIQEFINNRHKYQVDYAYQRPEGVWSMEDKQCLIDTILQGEPMPLFFLNLKSDNDVYFIVDGQQRLHTIKNFYDNKIKLNRKFSGEENHGKTFNGDNPISDEIRNKFLDYSLNFNIIEDYDDEKIRMIFSRLQRGKPLTLGERLNAQPGEIVLRLREIANHPFMKKSIAVASERYGNYPDVARIMLYEKKGFKDVGTQNIIGFFEKNKNLSENDSNYKNIISVLNYLSRCFNPEPGKYKYLSKHVWVFTLYTLTRELLNGYVMSGEEENLKKFLRDFHNKIYSEDHRRSNSDFQKFYENVRGGWSEKLLELRHSLILREYLKKSNIKEKDEKRQIREEQKIEVFGQQEGICQKCGTEFKDHGEPEYHHKKMHSLGGETKINNIIILCKECHKKIHGSEDVKLSSSDMEKELNG